MGHFHLVIGPHQGVPVVEAEDKAVRNKLGARGAVMPARPNVWKGQFGRGAHVGVAEPHLGPGVLCEEARKKRPAAQRYTLHLLRRRKGRKGHPPQGFLSSLLEKRLHPGWRRMAAVRKWLATGGVPKLDARRSPQTIAHSGRRRSKEHPHANCGQEHRQADAYGDVHAHGLTLLALLWWPIPHKRETLSRSARCHEVDTSGTCAPAHHPVGNGPLARHSRAVLVELAASRLLCGWVGAEDKRGVARVGDDFDLALISKAVANLPQARHIRLIGRRHTRLLWPPGEPSRPEYSLYILRHKLGAIEGDVDELVVI
mmetsp:Transcript_24607/g.69141  ORF Transcript_24607/g.69141 Transcript_24607/m.69141 type:complete len:314 (-) Transcript_24607:275-1216(-)|eukprot:scaffold176650_cov35-Tisochrysis_lutea.AAC.1